MKIKITDLLDSYHDTSVKLSPTKNVSRQEEPTPITTAKKSGLKRPLTAVACFILLACATTLVGLRFAGGNEGTSLSQPETGPAGSGFEFQEESCVDAIGYESVTEPEEAMEETSEELLDQTPEEEPVEPEAASAEISKKKPEESLIESVVEPDYACDPAVDTDGDGYLTAWLTYDTIDSTIVKLQLNVTENTFAWYIHNEELIDAYVAWEAGTGDWDTFDTLHTTVFNQLLDYFNDACIVFTDGTKVPLGSGDSIRLEDDLIREESIVSLTSTSQDYYPAYLEFDGTRYDFE